ncbi:MAG TPA: aminoglycoside phosphotransferase family protein, partial [Trueperaceae bacterium]|nr:aminoglycoside phosphotransferase family protein [Trueperaceae bacterium]
LRFWDGDPTVRLLAHDEASGAMLLERCRPGHDLNVLPEEERDVVLARLVPRLWRRPPEGHGFRHLSEMISHWTAETLAGEERWPDAALVREGLAAWAELSRPAAGDVLLGTDVHAGNVLAAEREPWLVIDPKPFVGDPAYDATQHLFDARDRLAADPVGFVRRYAALLGLPEGRVRAWAFARFAAEHRDDAATWAEEHALARRLAP